MTPRRHTLLGLLFLTAVGILSYYTLFKTDFSFFEERQTMTAFTEDARGLRKGSPVLYAGVRWGKVTSVIPDMTRPREERVKIELSLDEPIKLFGDHKVAIESASVLGGVQLGIDPGSAEEGEISTDQPLRASSAPDVLAALGQVVDENREPLRNAIAGIDRVVASLNGSEGTLGLLLNDQDTSTSFSNAVKSLQGTLENTEALTEELRSGQGTIGKLVYDTKLYDDIERFVTGLEATNKDIQTLLKDAREGDGVINALVYDSTVADNLKATTESIRSAAAKIDTGDGAIARLINDGSIVDDLKAAIGVFSNPDGTIGKLFNDPAVYDQIQLIVGDIADATAALRDQRGVLGVLFYDNQARDQLLQAINVLTGGLEEQREAAPIATFLSTVFLGF